MDENSLNLRTKLMAIRETQEADHPKAPILASTLTPIYNYGRGSSARFQAYTLEEATDFFHSSQGVKVHNYSPNEVNKAKLASQNGSTNAIDMTQETYNGIDDDDLDFFRARRTMLS